MPRVHVQKAAKDYPYAGISKGDIYYKWKFRYGGLHRSLTRPKPSQLTQSPFLSAYYGLQEAMTAFFDTLEDYDPEEPETVVDDLTAAREEWCQEIDALREMSEESLEAMPDTLQDSSESGMLLQERIDAMYEWEQEIQDYNTPDFDGDGSNDFSVWITELRDEIEALDPGTS